MDVNIWDMAGQGKDSALLFQGYTYRGKGRKARGGDSLPESGTPYPDMEVDCEAIWSPQVIHKQKKKKKVYNGT